MRAEDKDFGYCTNKKRRIISDNIEGSYFKDILEPEKRGFIKKNSNLNTKSGVLFMKKIKADLRGYNYVRTQIAKRYPNDPIFVKLLKYSDLVIEDYIKRNNKIITKNFVKRSKPQLRFEKDGNLSSCDYLIKGDPNFDIILNSRSKYGYAAIVYMLMSKLQTYKNRVYFGFSKHEVKKRVQAHIRAAIAPHGFGPECKYVNYVKLHRAIINALEYNGIDVDTEYYWLESKKGTETYDKRMEYLFQILKECFEIKTVEIHKGKHTARLSENYYTKNYINDDGSIGTVENGLNEIQGGSDG